MSLHFAALSLIAIVLAVVALAVALYSWRMRATFGSVPLLLLALVAAGWSLAYGLEVASTTEASKLLWAKVQWVGLTLTPLLWLACAARGASNERLVFGRGRWLLWLLIPALLLMLAWTNEWHGLIWSEVRLSDQGLTQPLRLERGAFFWVEAFFALGLCLLVTMIATAAVMRLPMFRRRFAGAVLLGTALPWLGNMLYLVGLDLFAPLAYLMGGLLLSWGLYQIRSLNLVPIARSTVVENMPDGMLVLDDKDRVLDCNLAALQLLGLARRDYRRAAGRRGAAGALRSGAAVRPGGYGAR